MEKIIILNGTISEIPIIKKAKEMGYYVITTGNMDELPGHQYADEYIKADYSNCEEILQIVKENDIRGIVSCANDFGVITSSYIAEKMGWKGHDSYQNALLMHHKDLFMKYFTEKGFPVPWYRIFTDIRAAELFCKSCKYPIIIKANDLTGGKGINRADSFEEAKGALEKAFSLSRDKKIIVEPFLVGKQQSIVVFIANKKIIMTSSSDIYCMRNPYLVQAETYPATDFDKAKGRLYEIMNIMIDDMSLVDGILSFQYIVEDGVPYVIDMMRRCFGNETLLLADEMTGFPWEEAYIRASLGLNCESLNINKNSTKYCGHYGVMAEKNGQLLSYNIPNDIRKKIFKETVNLKSGERVGNYMTDKIAHIYFRYDDFEQMKRDILEYNDRIEVRIK